MGLLREGTLKEITPSSARKTCKGEYRGRSRVSSREREQGKWREIKSQFRYSPQRVRLSASLVSDSPQFPGHRGEAEVIIAGRYSVMVLPLRN